MTVVVADISPLNYLTLIELIDVLPRLYGRVVIPQEVLSELTSPAAPREVREWAKTLPDWIEVRSVPVSDDPALSNLDAGERSAIALAQSETNALLLIDEAAGRREASRRGISNTGTLGILRAGARRADRSAVCAWSAARDQLPRDCLVSARSACRGC